MTQRPINESFGSVVREALTGALKTALCAAIHGKRIGLSPAQIKVLRQLDTDLEKARLAFDINWQRATDGETGPEGADR